MIFLDVYHSTMRIAVPERPALNTVPLYRAELVAAIIRLQRYATWFEAGQVDRYLVDQRKWRCGATVILHTYQNLRIIKSVRIVKIVGECCVINAERVEPARMLAVIQRCRTITPPTGDPGADGITYQANSSTDASCDPRSYTVTLVPSLASGVSDLLVYPAVPSTCALVIETSASRRAWGDTSVIPDRWLGLDGQLDPEVQSFLGYSMEVVKYRKSGDLNAMAVASREADKYLSNMNTDESRRNQLDIQEVTDPFN